MPNPPMAKGWKEIRIQENVLSLPNAENQGKTELSYFNFVKFGSHLAYQFSTDLQLSYPCYLEPQ